MQLNYELRNHGWARVTLACEGKSVVMVASYLNDPLREFANAAIALVGGANEAIVICMSEPGEHQIKFIRKSGGIDVEIDWYDDWKHEGPSERLLAASTTALDVKNSVLSELKRIHAEIGETEYKKRWIEADFPTKEMEALVAAG